MQDLNVIVNPKLGAIDTNFEELKTAISEEVKQFEVAKFNEESKGIAKKVVANLRKMKTKIDDKRKEAKNYYMQPYMELENKCNELKAIIDKPIEHINTQVEEYEVERKVKRQQAIYKLYETQIGPLGEYLPLSALQSDKWLNATTTEKSIKDEIDFSVQKVHTELTAINSNPSDGKAQALEVYKNTLDFAKAIQSINDYEAQKIEILKSMEADRIAEEQQRLEREREAIRAEERARMAEEARIKEEAKREVIEEIAQPITDEIVTNAKVSALYTVSASAEELGQIEMFFNSIGVAFERKDV